MVAIEAILFDKDGTLFDYHRTWANWSRRFLLDLAEGDAALARRLGEAVGFDLDAGSFREDSPLVSETPHESARALLPLLPGASLAGLVTRMSALAATVPQAEATPLAPLLGELAGRGLRLGLVTNDGTEPTLAHLRAAGIEHAFAHVLACDSGYAAKPAPDMLLAACGWVWSPTTAPSRRWRICARRASSTPSPMSLPATAVTPPSPRPTCCWRPAR